MTLELSGLSTAYAGFDFGPVDLAVDDEVLAVLGPSGSGKTTLLSLIAGLTTPESGSIRLGRRELVGRPLDDRGVGMVFQEGALFPHMTARENVAYAADTDEVVEELAALLELDGVLDRRPPALSGGEGQRVALARTLAADPEVLLLDEPLSSLDAPTRRRLRTELHDLFDSLSIPVLYVTHDQRTATALGDRLAIVRDGSVEQIGPPVAVLDRPTSRFVARFTGTENRFDATVVDRSEDGAWLRCGGLHVRTAVSTVPDTGTVCIHPSRVEVGANTTDDATTATGTVSRWLNEGTAYRLEIAVDTVTLTATVRPPTFERLEVAVGDELRVAIPPDAVHVIPEAE